MVVIVLSLQGTAEIRGSQLITSSTDRQVYDAVTIAKGDSTAQGLKADMGIGSATQLFCCNTGPVPCLIPDKAFTMKWEPRTEKKLRLACTDRLLRATGYLSCDQLEIAVTGVRE